MAPLQGRTERHAGMCECDRPGSTRKDQHDRCKPTEKNKRNNQEHILQKYTQHQFLTEGRCLVIIHARYHGILFHNFQRRNIRSSPCSNLDW